MLIYADYWLLFMKAQEYSVSQMTVAAYVIFSFSLKILLGKFSNIGKLERYVQ